MKNFSFVFLLLLISEQSFGAWLTISPANAKENDVIIKRLAIKPGDMWCRDGIGFSVEVPKSRSGEPITHALLGVKNQETMSVSLSSPLAIPENGQPALICLSPALIADAVISISYGDDICGPKEHLRIELMPFLEKNRASK